MDKRFTGIRPPINGSAKHPSLFHIIDTYFSLESCSYKGVAQEYISKWCEEEAKIQLPLGKIEFGELETTDTVDYAKIVDSVLSFVLEFSKTNSHANLPYACDWSNQLLKTVLETIKKHQN